MIPSTFLSEVGIFFLCMSAQQEAGSLESGKRELEACVCVRGGVCMWGCVYVCACTYASVGTDVSLCVSLCGACAHMCVWGRGFVKGGPDGEVGGRKEEEDRAPP